MRPLSEWTEAELRDELFDLHMHTGEAFDELLRRAREAERAAVREGVRADRGCVQVRLRRIRLPGRNRYPGAEMTPIRHHEDATGHALMCAILASPFDMLPRLVYADWLEENGQADRAEFIRLQIEIEDIREQTGGCEPPTVFTRRETDLFNRNHGRWFWRDGTGDADGFGLTIVGNNPSGRWLHVCNGFGSVLTTDLAWWLGESCPCGVSDAVMDRYRLPRHDSACTTCHGTGTTPGHGAEVVSHHPVTRVVVADREPDEDYEGCFFWPFSDIGNGVLPREILVSNHLSEMHESRVSKTFPTREAAVEALSRFLVDLARDQAGLPKLELEVSQ